MGLVDRLHELGLACFGPVQAAARIESSKSFAKALMSKYNIPTAAWRTCDNPDEAREYLRTAKFPLVIKADGLALGKGVVIAETLAEAEEAVERMMEQRVFGSSGDRIIIEEFLTGPEVTVLTFTDGKTLVPMMSSMDHKRIGEGDQGPNTGGMGVIAPNPFYTPEIAQRCMDEIFLPTIRGLQQEGCAFKGCLYFGLMLTPEGPKVIEYNSRFGDPEAQAILPLLESDLVEIMLAVEQGRLTQDMVRFSNQSSCCLVLASQGYPGSYKTGFPINNRVGEEAQVCYAGCRIDDGELLTAGGRVLSVTTIGEDLPAAIKKTYNSAKDITFEGCYYRRDIGARALDQLNQGKEQF